MNNSQFFSVLGAILAVLVGGISIFLGWVTPPEGMAIIFAGLSILGIHTGGSYAGSQR